MRNMQIELAGMKLNNPMMVASGTFGYGREYAQFYDLSRLGAIMVKGVSIEPWVGNPVPRIVETPAGMLNAIGLQNPGVDYFIDVDLPFLTQFDTRVIVNIIGRSIEEYVAVTQRLSEVDGVDAIEINISCPNIKEGGIHFGTDPQAAADVVRAVKKATHLPVIPKLSPNVTDVRVMARAVQDAGADAISLINTLLGMVIDPVKRRPVLANTVGGLSGPAIRPIAVRMVWEVFEVVEVPLIGMGGIMTGDDAMEFVLAGASAVSVGTANFAEPTAAIDVLEELTSYVEQSKMSFTELIGDAHNNV